jgi:hypothetical protein
MRKADEYRFEELQFKDTVYPIKQVFIAVKNGRSAVLDGLKCLSENEVKEIKSIFRKMASIENFRSPKVKWRMSKYKYGEIKPKGKRIFFFQKCGDNIILFGYRLKKKESLGDKVYRALDKERQEYEREFERYYK